MTHEEELLAQTANIINDAARNQKQSYDKYMRQVALRLEEQLWQEFGVQEAYALWRLKIVHQGDQESIDAFKSELLTKEPNSEEIQTEPHDSLSANSVCQMELMYYAKQDMPEDIKALLSSARYTIPLHLCDQFVGIVARTGAWQSKATGVRPSEAPDKESITLTCVAAQGQMTVISRSDTTGKRNDEAIMTIPYFVPSTKEESKTVIACAQHLAENHGEMASAIYLACTIPLLMKLTDPEMFAASVKDLGLTPTGSDDNQSSDKPTGEDNQ